MMHHLQQRLPPYEGNGMPDSESYEVHLYRDSGDHEVIQTFSRRILAKLFAREINRSPSAIRTGLHATAIPVVRRLRLAPHTLCDPPA